jgi:hypothetical protein
MRFFVYLYHDIEQSDAEQLDALRTPKLTANQFWSFFLF